MGENDYCLRTSGEQFKWLKLAVNGCAYGKKIKTTQSERGVQIGLSVAERVYSERMSRTKKNCHKNGT